MKIKELQIVTFDNPYPPNFGGVIDVFYKIKALNDLGIKIYLHFFFTDRTKLGVLKDLCETIYTYKRNTSFINHFKIIPFRVASRCSNELYYNLKKSSAPILFEGLHSTSVLRKHSFKNLLIFRAHNIEHQYMIGIGRNHNNIFKKTVYYIETFKQKKYEKVLFKMDAVLAISKYDYSHFESKFSSKTFFVPPFHGNKEKKIILEEEEEEEEEEGKEKFALYHGDLSSLDNINSALFLISVFEDLPYKFIIAASKKSKKISDKIKNLPNVYFHKLSSNKDLNTLLYEAQINVLFSTQRSGTKLKVFTALYKGKHCIVNHNMIDDDLILKLCDIAENKSEYRNMIKKLFNSEFKITNERIEILKKYSSSEVAKQMIFNLSSL